MIDSPASQPMQERLTYLRCGRCNWPIAEVNMLLPAEVSVKCGRCTRDQGGKPLAVYTMLRVVVAPSSESR